MGYAGYVPAKMPPSALMPAEQALQAIQNAEALDIIQKLHYNLATMPKEDKYRRVKLSNKRIADTLVAVPGALDAMLALGWVREEGADELLVPEKKYFSMAEVRMVDAAKALLKKRQEEAFKKELRQKKAEAAGGNSASSLVPPVQA